MALSLFKKAIVVCTCMFGIAACDDDVFDRIDAEIESFEVSPTNINVGDRMRIRWESSGAISFDAKVYLSEDRQISGSDTIIVDERCSYDSDRNCRAGEVVRFDCYYRMDLDLDCEEDNELLDITNIGGFLDEIPKEGYVILELCNDNDECESRSERVRFN